MENCFFCSKELNKLNTPLFGVGKTKDNKSSCTSCHREISTKLHKTKFSNDNSENILNEISNFEITEKVTFKERVKQNLPNEILNKSENVNISKKWYDNKILLIILFFVLPPLGIYAIIKYRTDTWKKAVYIIPAVVYTFFVSMLILGIIISSNIDHYKDGLEYYKKGNLELALQNFSKVERDNENYNLAQTKIIEIEKTKRILEEQKQKEYEKSIIKLKEFQKIWADSILKSESQVGNRHFVSHKLNLPDTIVFEYTEGVTKNGFGVNFKNDTLFYRNHYKEQLSKKYPNKFQNVKTYITFIPNKNIDYTKVLAENKAKSERKEKILRQFSQWDGSHSALKRLVKDNMNDPGSFDHIETTYSDKGSYILVQMKFRQKNSFGAKIISVVTAKVDVDGNILSIKQQF